jgi:uncharacterized protein (TIGR02246 family)
MTDQETSTVTSAHAREPGELAQLFMRHLTAGDLDALAALYADDAVFVPAPGSPVRGRAGIRDALAEMHRAGARIVLEPRAMHVAGDVAVFSNVATVSGATPDGGEMVTTTTEVARRGPDGRWRYIVDDPFFSA